MNSTIRSLAAIALSVATASAMAASAPSVTNGQRNTDALDAWFTPQKADHPDQLKAAAAKQEALLAAQKAQKERSKDAMAQKRAEPNTGMQ